MNGYFTVITVTTVYGNYGLYSNYRSECSLPRRRTVGADTVRPFSGQTFSYGAGERRTLTFKATRPQKPNDAQNVRAGDARKRQFTGSPPMIR